MQNKLEKQQPPKIRPLTPTITLTTDFGSDSPFVGVMKGVILCRTPAAQIVDLCHAIPPHDIIRANYLIYDNFHYFPKGSIHVIVVDPGVGSNRGVVLLDYCGHFFLAPDNGLLTLLLKESNKNEAKAFMTDRNDLYLNPLSNTFHGRDVFAPLAAHLAAGNLPESLGSRVALKHLKTIKLPEITVDRQNSQIHGVVTSIDHFGNLITNIPQTVVEEMMEDNRQIQLSLGNQTISSLQTNYSSTPPGTPLLIFNSSGYLEIAVNQERATDHLNTKVYDKVTLSVC